MTKIEFLTDCNFNSLTLKEQIQKAVEMVEADYDSISGKADCDLMINCDKDGNPSEDGKFRRTNEELTEANKVLRETFPMLEPILRSWRINDFDLEKSYVELSTSLVN